MTDTDRVVLRRRPHRDQRRPAHGQLTVRNTGDRAVQVGSHYHFFEANRALSSTATQAYGMHLDIPAGTAVRFEPGDSHQVELCAYGGGMRLVGFSGLLDGGIEPGTPGTGARRLAEPASPSGRASATDGSRVPKGRRRRSRRRARSLQQEEGLTLMATLTRKQYADLFGPTAGDRFRLADTDLVVEVEHDYTTGHYGDEAVFGGGKTIRDGMAPDPAADRRAGRARPGDHQRRRASTRCSASSRATSASRTGAIAGIGKAGNPHTQDGVDPRLVIGAGTEVIAGEHLIATAGGDRHPRPLHLPAAGRGGALQRHHHADRRRHRPDRRHQRHDLHARPVEHRPDAPGRRGPAGQRRHPRQGQRQPARRAGRADRGRAPAA